MDDIRRIRADRVCFFFNMHLKKTHHKKGGYLQNRGLECHETLKPRPEAPNLSFTARPSISFSAGFRGVTGEVSKSSKSSQPSEKSKRGYIRLKVLTPQRGLYKGALSGLVRGMLGT